MKIMTVIIFNYSSYQFEEMAWKTGLGNATK